MSDDRRNTNRPPGTGTVPKKCRNNTSFDRHHRTNNLVGVNLPDCLRNQRRNLPPYNAMTTVEEQRQVFVNGGLTPNSSSSTSRRNSSSTIPKCDNVTKCPDKKQIEDKLDQIREYLQITTSLMSNMKNHDDQMVDAIEWKNLAQMINDLKDSEKKLVDILKSMDEMNENQEQIDRNDNYSETATCNSNRNDFDDQVSLSSLQQKAENRLRDARQVQEKLLSQYDINSTNHQRDKNFPNVQDFDIAIRELEERTKRLNEPQRSAHIQDRLVSDVDSLHSQIMSLHTINEDRNQMIQMLDNRDSELRAQHVELQSKLSELQSKKSQIDQLVYQLQNLDDADDEDVGAQVRRIVSMKDQLSKLKDMLGIVKATEGVMQNSTQDEQECDICTKTENLLSKDTENRRKQTNKNAIAYDRQGARPRSRSNAEKIALQAELEAKKRELEEIMGKHKASTSNLNTDNKSEFSSYIDPAPTWPPTEQNDSSDSEERDLTNAHYSVPVMKTERTPEYVHLEDCDRLSSLPRSPERTPRQRRSNSVQSGKSQVQKQLELIRSVCDSMLDQNNVRNNLTTPTSMYSEPRRFGLMEMGAPEVQHPYQNWLATNNLQTQAFMLNTLNQCCQMLWLQQRELIGLRQVVEQMQDQFDSSAIPPNGARSNQKTNQVAAACSMPNLNQYNLPTNLDPTYQNNIQSARLLDNNNGDHINNSVLHPNINQMQWNNQVAPGNRANNYWDNFRSYSRQNLLSTKSNEGLANNPFAIASSVTKSNSDHTSSQENTPRRRQLNNSAIPPDVLNVNHKTEYYNEIASNTSNISEERLTENASRRNEWHEETNEESISKSKLFEELRDHVYKEVVTLISANETRPHFLIQLFRDLQMITSDPLRLKILQAIQTIITHSIITNRQGGGDVPDVGFSLQSTVWSKTLKNPIVTSRNTLENSETDNVIKEIVPFLNDHEEDMTTVPFLGTLKQVLIDSDAFREAVKDAVFKKHFSNVLDDVLSQYQGKKVGEIKMHLIQTINDLLKGELSFIQLIKETCPENVDTHDLTNGEVVVENGDLAEADQGRVEGEEEGEEEGAVGGFWELQVEEDSVHVEAQTQFIKQGLDQVPTRLPTRSRSNTPSKERSSSRSEHPEQF